MPNLPTTNRTNLYSSSSSLDSVALVTGNQSLQTSSNVKAKLVALTAINTSTSNAYIQVFDGYSSPSGTPLLSILVGAGSQGSIDLTNVGGLPVQTGIVIATSTTPATYTAGSATMWLNAWWTTR